MATSRYDALYVVELVPADEKYAGIDKDLFLYARTSLAEPSCRSLHCCAGLRAFLRRRCLVRRALLPSLLLCRARARTYSFSPRRARYHLTTNVLPRALHLPAFLARVCFHLFGGGRLLPRWAGLVAVARLAQLGLLYLLISPRCIHSTTHTFTVLSARYAEPCCRATRISLRTVRECCAACTFSLPDCLRASCAGVTSRPRRLLFYDSRRPRSCPHARLSLPARRRRPPHRRFDDLTWADRLRPPAAAPLRVRVASRRRHSRHDEAGCTRVCDFSLASWPRARALLLIVARSSSSRLRHSRARLVRSSLPPLCRESPRA